MCDCASGSPLQLSQNEPVLSQTVAFVEGKCRGWWAQSIFEFSSSNVWENAGRGRLEHCIMPSALVHILLLCTGNLFAAPKHF